MKATRRENGGITLIALVITIIVLLILAGVAISMLSGENGILNQAAKAREDTKQKSTLEQVELAVTGAITNTKHKVEEKILKDELGRSFGNEGTGYTIEGDEETGWTVGVKEEKYAITSNGEVQDLNRTWRCEERDGETVVVKGDQVLKIGEEIDYNCTVNEKGTEVVESYTSYGTVNGYGTDYTYNAKDYTGKWGILGAENGKLLIMPMQNVTNTSSTPNNLGLGGRNGYKNGISELDEISKIYGHGKGAIGARSIKIEDVDKVTGYNPNNIGVRDFNKKGVGIKYGANSIGEYGNKVTYYWKGDEYPYYIASNGITGSCQTAHSSFNWLDKNINDWKVSEQSTSAQDTEEGREKITEITSDIYLYFPETLTLENNTSKSVGIKHDSKAYTMLFENTSSDTHYYWLGSQYVFINTRDNDLGLRYVSSGQISYYFLCLSGAKANGLRIGVRPVVFLKPDVQLIKEGDVWKIQ